MKKIITIVFQLITVVAFAQNDVLKDTVLKPVITEIGKPDGEKVNLKIGEEGGRMKSSDGKVELVFPAGALTENTNIIIQPVTNLAPNGSGKTYWFEPSGIQFKKPVQIIFNYTDEEAEICPPDLMGLAIQNKQGQWSFINYDTWDSTSRSLKGSITHFSGATNVNKMMLSPNAGLLPVSTKLAIEIIDISTYFEEGDSVDFLPTFFDIAATLWYVNDREGGSGRYGYIRPDYTRWADYTAPSTVPDKNPVIIKAEIYLLKKSRGGKTLNLRKTLKSKIHVYDEYVLDMICHSEGYAGSSFGKCTYKDTGRLVIRFYGKQTEIIEKINKNTVSELGYKDGKCKIETLKPGSGNLHISGITGTMVTPATYTKPATVEISFDRAPLILPLLEVDCPGKKKSRDISNTERGTAFAAQYMRAMPIKLKFEAKQYKGKVVIETFGAQGTAFFYQVEISQIKDD